MREIKFRVFEKNNGRMKNVEELTWHQGKILFYNDSELFSELMQYLGLKDETATDICEGDIIKCSQYIGTWTVIFKHGCFGLQGNSDASGLSGSINDNFFSFSEALTPDTLKILGNIHENKELLK